MNLQEILFFDVEADPKTGKIKEIGAYSSSGNGFPKLSSSSLFQISKAYSYIAGQNILNHDLPLLKVGFGNVEFLKKEIIDTLFLSPLLFPKKPHHNLDKDYKLDELFQNDPVNDSKQAGELLKNEIETFLRLSLAVQSVYFNLLSDKRPFQGFFKLLSFKSDSNQNQLQSSILEEWNGKICNHSNIEELILKLPVELAYSLALIREDDRSALIPGWVTYEYPDIYQVLKDLRLNPCSDESCEYCTTRINHNTALKKWFGFDKFRDFDGLPLQENVVKASLTSESLLTVFPTGGGKSMTFQLPALMIGEATQGLTVVISPLQSLMKDQVDNLNSKGIEYARTINGLLSPLERQEALAAVEEGIVWLLYISPESLRSNSIKRILYSRNIARFVIDEAHCFSAWGQDFRVDYLYIGKFIKNLQEEKKLRHPIPVSCFTATAKLQVIQDIKEYFTSTLQLNLIEYKANASRKNLHFKIIEIGDSQEKYLRLRELLESSDGSKIVYVARTKRSEEIASKLQQDHFRALPFHGKLDVNTKTRNQESFMKDETEIIVATSAFGMGVDKPNVKLVVHYEISDSLENYVQEAGRAGRDPELQAECYILYQEDDLNKHFALLNQSKLALKEVQDIWRAIKNLTKLHNTVSQSTLEIARKAGWNDEIDKYVETRITTAIAALEEAGYVIRGNNSPRIFATSLLINSVDEAQQRIQINDLFNIKEKETAIRIIKKLFSDKKTKRKETSDDIETRVDRLAEILGLEKREVIHTIGLLRQAKILSDYKDLTAFVPKSGKNKVGLEKLNKHYKFELALLDKIDNGFINLNEIREHFILGGITDCSIDSLRRILNYWEHRLYIKKGRNDISNNGYNIRLNNNKEAIREAITDRIETAIPILQFLLKRLSNDSYSEETVLKFSTIELKEDLEKNNSLFQKKFSIVAIEDALLYLHRMELLRLEGGFIVIYNALTIERKEKDPLKRVTKKDYEKLDLHYAAKREQIHIVGEYAKRLLNNYQEALVFVDDYFKLPYEKFLQRYFPGERREEIGRTITPAKFEELFGQLSTAQFEIVMDQSRYIGVLAGPGSGKTRLLVHKMASLLMVGEIKSSQLLMLTFSRSAALEFRKRLQALVGNAMLYVEINTFHSYCFHLLERKGELVRSEVIINEAIEQIKSGEIPVEKISNRSVLLIDEAQDMSKEEYALVELIIKYNDGIRVIMVGDDDQNIYEFRGSSSEYLNRFMKDKETKPLELLLNYRSDKNIVDFSNWFLERLNGRLKKNPIEADKIDPGSVKIVIHPTGNQLPCIIKDIEGLNGSGGTRCVMTQTNDEARLIYSELKSAGHKVQLIQGNESLKIANLAEIRNFTNELSKKSGTFGGIISQDIWEAQKGQLIDYYKESPQITTILKIIDSFDDHYPKKLITDWKTYITEIKFEDIMYPEKETTWVSTIHKTKGKEFDHVIMFLNKEAPITDEEKRVLYVGFTRAKRELTVHYAGEYLAGGIEINIATDNIQYPDSNNLIISLNFKDVFLDFGGDKMELLEKIKPGDELFYRDDSKILTTKEGKPIVCFSGSFMNLQLNNFFSMGYSISKAIVNYKVFWFSQKYATEIPILLPILYLVKG